MAGLWAKKGQYEQAGERHVEVNPATLIPTLSAVPATRARTISHPNGNDPDMTRFKLGAD